MKKQKRIKKEYEENGQFVLLPHAVLDHPDYLSLTWGAQCLLTHLARYYTGYNNGDISIPISKMKERGWSPNLLTKGKRELLEKDWIRQTRQGYKKVCSLFALSWYDLDDCKGKLDIDPKQYRKRSLKA